MYYVINISSTDEAGKIYPQDLASFTVELYTTDVSNPIIFTADDCLDDVLHINSTDLERLPQGALKIRFRIGLEDESYADGQYNSTFEKQTGFFLKHLKTN